MEENVNNAPTMEQTPSTPEQPKVETSNNENSAEETLTYVANIILGFGILATIVCCSTLMFIEGLYRKEFNPAGFATTIEVLAGTIIAWASLKVLANISLTLKEINRKLK